MITSVSMEEYRSHSIGGLPAMEQVADGVWTLPIPYRPGHLPFTFAYLVEDAEGDVHVVDPGWDSDSNFDIITNALARIVHGGRAPASVIVTHLHSDHMGLAGRLRSTYGSPVFMHWRDHEAQESYLQWANDDEVIRAGLDVWGVPDARVEELASYAKATVRVVVPADGVVNDGDVLPVAGRRLRVVHTPGHTPGHMCVHDQDADLLFTGDHLLPRVTPGLGDSGPFPENPLELYLASLEKVAAYDRCQSLPGHEYRYFGIAERAAAIAERHLRRAVEVEMILTSHPEATAWEVASRVGWAQGWESLTRHYLIGALRQTAMHVSMVRSGGHTRAFGTWGRPKV